MTDSSPAQMQHRRYESKQLEPSGPGFLLGRRDGGRGLTSRYAIPQTTAG
jgi:hypothetical protein